MDINPIINPKCPTCKVELSWYEIIGNWVFIEDYAFEKNLGICPCCNKQYTWTSRYLNDNYELSFNLKKITHTKKEKPNVD